MGTSSANDPLADLAVAIALLAESGNPAAVRVAEALAGWLAGSDCLETALGAAPGARQARRQRGRDDAIRRLAQRFPAASARAMAKAVHLAVRRYEASSWPRDRAAGRRPDSALGDVYDLLANGALPSKEALRRFFNGIGG